MKKKKRTNAKRKLITVTSTLNVATPLAHSTVLAYKDTREMACSVLVRKHSVIILAELNSFVVK